ncbi:transcriptional activator FtrA [Pannonibacter phragmitetus]|uniref:Transcriptional activator FtrA n=1 Tax=Pannonibacter phragmitetus TaxID=121719 RepID=A0A378ZZR2_9HYPH|nr:DJ-1/PfpI family protein [Pannonibacter phragmitetus]SUB02716.1 transcriptional activator FtrA [Pannonibacter phragmitetus]
MTLQIGLLAFPAVQQLDLTGPYEVFASAAGTKVHLVWKTLAPVTSATGLKLIPDMTFADCPQLDVICVPGGAGVNALLQDEEVLDFIRRQAAGARYVTSVCTGSLVLGAAGLLEGRKAATHWNAMDFLPLLGATAQEGRSVRDGKIITAGGVTSGIDFGLTVVAELLGEEEAKTVQLAIEYAPAPPFDAGTPAAAGPDLTAAARQRMAKSRSEREEIIGRLKS